MRNTGLSLGAAIALTLLISGCSAAGPESDPTASGASDLSYEDRQQQLAQCLRDSGYPDVEIQPDGGIGIGLPKEQTAPFAEASEACSEQLGFNNLEVTDDDLDAMYAAGVEGAKCLKDEGFSVSDAPSLETYKDSDSEDRWNPWFEVPTEQAASALEACPQPML